MNNSEQTGFERNIKIVRDANNSNLIPGDHNIIITNYYYREDIKVAPVTSADINADDNLPCPYRGLFHFSPNDAEFFFGREVFIEELIQATVKRNFIPVLGASGSGKSSVVLAGLVPKLQQEGCWLFTHFRPGSDPFHALAESLVPLYTSGDATTQIAQARALARYFHDDKVTLPDIFSHIQRQHPNHRVLLIADQFEELYTLCNDEKTRTSFLDTLLAGFQSSSGFQSPPVLVATMRADFLGNALSYPAFGDLLQNTDIKIRSMNHSELSQVIVKPAEKMGITFEAGLVERILDDVEDKPGNLPLLQFALTLLWQQRMGKQLTHTAYDAIGEVQGALARYADERYDKLSATEQEQVQRIFIQLVRPGEGTEDTLRLATKAELGETSWALVTEIANARLVVTSRNTAEQETVEVVHEALIHNWGKLRQWMETDRTFRAWQERLRAAIQQWNATGRDEAALLRGKPLADAQEWLQKRPEELAAEQEYIQTSLVLQKREREQQERQRLRVISGLAGGLVGALFLAGVAGVGWWRTYISETNTRLRLLASSSEVFLNLYEQKKKSLRENERSRENQKKENQAKQRKELANQHKEALILAIKAGRQLQRANGVESGTRTQVLAALQQSVDKPNGVEINLPEHYSSIKDRTSIAESPDGKKLAYASWDGTVQLWDIYGRELKTFGDSNRFKSVSFSPDGKTVASGNSDGTVKLWDTITGSELKTLKGHSGSVYSISFSPDGKTIASSSGDGMIKLWNVTTGSELKTLEGYSGSVSNVSFSPDGKTIASSSLDGRPKLWNVTTGSELKTLEGYLNSVYSISFSPDGKTIAFGSDGKVKLWDIATDSELTTLDERSFNSVNIISFSPDGKTIASASADGTMKLWDTTTYSELKTLDERSFNSVYSVCFSPNGKTIASTGTNGTVKLWDTTTGKELKTLEGHSDSVYSVSFSSDGKTIASASADGTVKLWDATIGKELKTLKGNSREITSISFSLGGKTIASASTENTVIKLWNPAGKELKTLEGHSRRVTSVAISPDGKIIASASQDMMVKLWDATTGKELKTLKGHLQEINSVNFSPDGKTIASISSDDTMKLWDVMTGKELKTLKGSSLDTAKMQVGRDKVSVWQFPTGVDRITLKRYSREVTGVFFGRDGKTILFTNRDGSMRIWDVMTGREEFSRWFTNLYSVAHFSPDGKTITSASWDGTVKLWDVATGTELKTLKVPIARATGIDFSHDGKTIAYARLNNTVTLWDVTTGSELKTLKGRSKRIDDISFSPDDRTIISQSKEDGTVQLWNVTTGKELKTFKRHSASDTQVSFSPDGKILASAGEDGTVKLWDITTGRELKTFKRHLGLVNSITFNRNGKILASAGEDGTVKLWDITTGRELKTFKRHIESVTEARISPDGKTMVSTGSEGTVKLWDVTTGSLLKTYQLDSFFLSSGVGFTADGKSMVFLGERDKVHLWNFDLDDLLVRGCNQVRDYLKTNPDINENDKHLCDSTQSVFTY